LCGRSPDGTVGARKNGEKTAFPVSHEDPQRHRLLRLLLRHGWNAMSFQSIESEFRYWFAPEGNADAAVAYLDTGRAWVVAGAPVAPIERCAEVARPFADEAHRHRRRVTFFATEPRFLEAAPMWSLVIGEQPSWQGAGKRAAAESERGISRQCDGAFHPRNNKRREWRGRPW
jgi:phosphatidylglycerol lysyltransferase